MLDLLRPTSSQIKTIGKGPLSSSRPLEEEEAEWRVRPWDLPGVRNFNPKVYMLMAPRGQGKTVAQTAMARFMLDAYEARKIKVEVLANYAVNFARISDPHLLDQLIEFPMWGRNKLVLIDEVTEFAPSGRAQSNTSRDIASFIRQIRKRGVDIITNTQYPVEVDRRILRQTDLFIEVEMKWRRRGPREGGSAWKADVDMWIYDYWGFYNRSNWGKARRWPPIREEADGRLTFENVHTVFPMFNTYEIQVAMWAPGRESILAGEGWSPAPEDEGEIPEPMPGVASARAGNSFDEFLVDRQRTQDGSLNVNMIYDAAREWHPEWKKPKDFQVWLTENGWEIGTDPARRGGNSVMAYRK